MSPGRRRVAAPAIALLGLLAAAAGAEGQQQPPADSTRARILERLNRLARPVGYDSVLFLQDSARLAEAQQGDRPATSGMDSIARALTSVPGYTLTEYDAESADFRAGSRVLVLTAADGARARVSQEGNVIEADSTITLDEPAGRIRTNGMATFTPPDTDPVDAANMIYDLSQARGSANDARTSLEQDGASWIVRGEMPFAARDSTFMSHAQFTSCDRDEPHYHFETDEIKIVGGNVLVARGVRLYFADVPVAWLPFMAQSLDRDRASGLLTPRFSVNDIVRNSAGYRRRVSNLGFYWAMSDYSDALFAMDWFSGQFFSATSSLRYRFNRQFLDGDLAVRQFWREDGSDELALDTRHSWQIDERTQLGMSARYAQSNQFVRDYSINPTEVTQSIDSEAGLNRRFDWGQVSFAANRRQFLSDDRTEWLLPSLNLSLSPITLFRANPSEAAFFNNMTWSGSSRYTRNAVDYEHEPADTFAIATANTATTRTGGSSSLNIGGLSFSQSVDMTESATFGVPEAYLLLGDSADPSGLVSGAPARDIAEARLGWSLGLSYQQQLIGSTTLTPRVTMNGDMFRSDTDSLAQSFVAGPSRVSFAATLKTDIYGFFGGFGGFEAIRHKISPSFDYSWTPETSPTDLQRAVFGVSAVSPRNTVAVTINQTFEAKRRADEQEEEEGAAAAQPDTATGRAGRPGGPRRLQQPDIVTLLALRTSVVRYDFVRADTLGGFTSGFETASLSNTISSDYLRGLSLSMDHELWEDVTADGRLQSRSFDLHLRQLNLGFSLGSSSSIFRWLGLGGTDSAGDEPAEPDPTDPLGLAGPTDESTVVPISGRDPVPQAVPGGGAGAVGGWNANLTYSLLRPRGPQPGQPAVAALRETTQMLSGSIRLQPTENWSMSWRTSYDLEESSFNDHSLRLTRDLHRWQANFDFLQTVTGNWTFRFEVSLLDNRDLKFDYDQQNLDLGLPSSQR